MQLVGTTSAILTGSYEFEAERSGRGARNALSSTLSEYRYRCAVDGAGGVGGKEGDHVGDGAGRNPFAVIGVGERGAVLRSVNCGRHDAIDVDIRGLEFVSQGFGETDHRALGRAVGGVTGVAVQAVAAGDIDDFSAALLEHLRDDRATAEQGRAQVDAEQKIPIGQVGFVRRLAAAPPSDGMDQDVRAIEASESLFNEFGEGFGIRQVNATGEQVVL